MKVTIDIKDEGIKEIILEYINPKIKFDIMHPEYFNMKVEIEKVDPTLEIMENEYF